MYFKTIQRLHKNWMIYRLRQASLAISLIFGCLASLTGLVIVSVISPRKTSSSMHVLDGPQFSITFEYKDRRSFLDSNRTQSANSAWCQDVSYLALRLPLRQLDDVPASIQEKKGAFHRLVPKQIFEGCHPKT